MEYLMQGTTREGELPILLRESLEDDGRRKYTNYSPDIVVQQVELFDPDKWLKENYQKDVSDDRSYGKTRDYIYVRCRNISNKTLENVYIHLYRNHLCMFNYPSGWIKNKMHTVSNQPAKIPSIKPDEIAVAPVFICDYSELGVHPNCFVAVASQLENPDFSYIDNSDKYIEWVNQKNVAARNVSVQYRVAGHTQWKVRFSNPDDKETLYYIIAHLDTKNAEEGMKYGFKNNELNIKRSVTYHSNDKNTFILTESVLISPRFENYLTVWTETVSGNAPSVRIAFGKAVPYGSALAKYAMPMNEGLKNLLAVRNPDMCLVPVGECTLQSIPEQKK